MGKLRLIAKAGNHAPLRLKPAAAVVCQVCGGKASYVWQIHAKLIRKKALKIELCSTCFRHMEESLEAM